MRVKSFPIRMVIAAPLALATTACGDDPEPAERDTGPVGEASGEVLGGSISDDMLPLEELRSQSPLAPRAAGEGSNSSAYADDEGDSDAAPSPETPEAEAPANTPAPEVQPEE